MNQEMKVDKTVQEKLFSLARSRGQLEQAKYRSASGADKIDAVLHAIEAKAFRRLGLGEPLEDVLKSIETEWKSFAIENNRKVDEAPKMKTGPSGGLSSIHYRWAGLDRCDSSIIFVRNMFNLVSREEP